MAAKNNWKWVLKHPFIKVVRKHNILKSLVKRVTTLISTTFFKENAVILIPESKYIFCFECYEDLWDMNNKIWHQIEFKVTKVLCNQFTAYTDWPFSWKPPETLKSFLCPPV